MTLAELEALGTCAPDRLLVRRLNRKLAHLDIVPDTGQLERLSAWLQLLECWGTAFNLTAIPPDERVSRLILMSAAAIPYLKTGKVLDVGSGAGVPGIPLAILSPGNTYTLIDSNGKKTRFLKQCRMELGLDNVRVVRARVEAFDEGAFDVIISRAFAGVGVFLTGTRHLARAGTRWLTFKNPATAHEMQHLPLNRAKWRMHLLQVPGLNQPVSLVAIEEAGS